MKKLFINSPILFLTLMFCDQPGKSKQPPYHTIKYKDAKAYINKFLLQNKELYQKAHNVSLGGFISKELFTEKFLAKVDAIRFYPCYIKDPINGDSVFLAFMRDENYDNESEIQCALDDTADLNHSSESFTYKSSDPSTVGVNQFITTQTGGIGMEEDTKKGRDVKIYAQEFLSQYTVNSRPVNSSLCGAFARDEILSLLDQVDPTNANEKICVGIRFFFGYDEERTNDKIRLILIGVDKNGKNITQYKDGSEPPMMERNWPPDIIAPH